MRQNGFSGWHTSALVAAVSLAGTASADQVFNDDVIITASLCVGFDCVNGEAFDFDTVRLKENNLRVHFDDTSSSSSFPANDWRITINDSANAGSNYFRVSDATAGRDIFTIGAGAPSNSLVVESRTGDIGLGTASPVLELHVSDGDSPGLRLEQNGSSGFTPQTWDIAGNETNFFVRDATNGSSLPFRIRAGAPGDAIHVAANGDVGLGTSAPEAPLHVKGNDGTTAILVDESSGTEAARGLLHLRNNGRVYFAMENTSIAETPGLGRIWNMQNSNGDYTITTSPGGPGEIEFALDADGNLTIEGDFISGTTTLTVPDYVFANDYALRPLSEVQAFIDANSHLPDVPSAAEIGSAGLNLGEMQMAMLRKIEELTLYTLDQEKRIATLDAELVRLRAD